jgi:hypothetical protein
MPPTRALGVALVAALVMACGGSSQPAANPSLAAAERLAGNWRLVAFQPSLGLEEPLKGLLEAQLKSLTISFQNGQFTARGPGVDASGRYEVTSASGDSLSGRVFDREGAGYGIFGQFVADQLRFTSTDAPWAGTGLLERAP